MRYNALTETVVNSQRTISGNNSALQVSTNQLSQTYLVGGGTGAQRLYTYDSVNNVVGAGVVITTDGITNIGSINDAAGWVPPTATIGDRVFTDINQNGLVDGSDTGIANVTVELIDDVNNNGLVDAGERVLATDTTNAAGEYAFTGVLPGNYIVRVTDTNGALGAGATYTTGGPINANADVPLVGASNNGIDFGLNNRAPVNSLPAIHRT